MQPMPPSSDARFEQPVTDEQLARAARRARRIRRRQLITLVAAIDLAILVAVALAWLAMRPDERDNVLNEGLRGSKPPPGATVPDPSRVAGIQPPVPAAEELDGAPALLVATCVDCRSGDIVGGWLARLVAEPLPAGASLVVVAWDGDVAAWRDEWQLDERSVPVHVATSAATRDDVQRRLGVGESGMAFVRDADGDWRSSFHLGQLDVEDVRHDIDAVG